MLLQSSLLLWAMIQVIIPGSQTNPRKARSEVNNVCSEAEGFFRVPESGNQCIKILGHQSGNWTASNKACQDEGLQLAKPIDPVALRKFIVEKLGDGRYYWIGGRVTDSGVIWNDGTKLHSNNNAWYPGYPGRFETNTDYCLKLLTGQTDLDEQPEKPYYIQPCEWTPNLFPMCECRCPGGFVKNNCNCFHFSSDSGNWTQARENCKNLGRNVGSKADLAEFGNSAKWLMDQITAKKTRFWLGASDPHNDGNWIWNSGRRLPLDYYFWAPDEPNNIDDDEYCLDTNNLNIPYMRLNDESCQDHHRYVCQIFNKNM